jgi:hypothetical protein
MTKQSQIPQYILDFISAICPEAPELYLASFDERKALEDATKIINDISTMCPFCKDTDFDLAGLKTHLEHGDCEVYNKTETYQRLF